MRKKIWPLILIIKILSSKFKLLKRFLLYLGFFSPGPRGKSLFTRHTETFLKYYKLGTNQSKSINSICELGPGESDYAFLAAAKKKVEFYESVDSKKCRFFYKSIPEKELINLGFIKEKNNYGEIIDKNYKYHPNGLSSLNDLKSNFFDFIYSHSVLQHLIKKDIDQILKNLVRISKRNSIHIHYIDFLDCFSSSKNNLRFDNILWENKIIHESGFYTNRISLSRWLKKFNHFGFKIMELNINRLKEIPIKKDKITKDIELLKDDIFIKNALVTLILYDKDF